jgi:hypothetical protein
MLSISSNCIIKKIGVAILKGYYKLFALPFILIISFTIFSGFPKMSEASLVEKLLKDRTETLHKVYFQQIDADTGEKLLYKIETQPLLTSDIEDLRKFQDTDMDVVKNMEILSIERTSDLYDRKSYKADILWHMQGIDGDYVQSIYYNVVIKKGGKSYKLSEFKPIIP